MNLSLLVQAWRDAGRTLYPGDTKDTYLKLADQLEAALAQQGQPQEAELEWSTPREYLSSIEAMEAKNRVRFAQQAQPECECPQTVTRMTDGRDCAVCGKQR